VTRLVQIVAVIVIGAAGYLALPAIASHRDVPTLDAVVGENDAFTIGFFFPDGTRVNTLKPGTYTVVVHDKSAIHNFHLASNFDSTVDFRTDVPFVGDQSFTVTFRPNTIYAYACEPHWQVMNGSFRTFAVATTTTTPAPPTVQASLSVVGAVKVRPASVRAGRVRLVVRDGSKRFGFHLTGSGVNRRTTSAFVGSTTWTLRLRAGRYHFGADPRPLRGILTAR
jgi:plastocyanin